MLLSGKGCSEGQGVFEILLLLLPRTNFYMPAVFDEEYEALSSLFVSPS